MRLKTCFRHYMPLFSKCLTCINNIINSFNAVLLKWLELVDKSQKGRNALRVCKIRCFYKYCLHFNVRNEMRAKEQEKLINSTEDLSRKNYNLCPSTYCDVFFPLQLTSYALATDPTQLSTSAS